MTGARADDGPATEPLTPVSGGAGADGDRSAGVPHPNPPDGEAAATPSACPRCAAPTVAGDRFCESCGADLRMLRGGTSAATRGPAATPCPHCGDRSAPDESDGFCPSCGLRRPDGTDHVETALDGAAAISDRGHVRPRNEDAVALGRAAGDAADRDAVAAVVCDGVSSVPNSERAARAAADAALEHLLRTVGTDGERRTRAAVAASAAAAAAVVPPGTRNAPSCTLVCGVVEPTGTVTVGWVGDSRAYWLAEETGGVPGDPSRLLTRDHVAANATPGRLDPAVVAARPDAITRWLGADGEPEPDVVTLAPPGPGLLLLCSDGLWKYFPDAADLAALARPALHAGGPAAVATALVEAALAAGGEDNVTVAVIPVPPIWRSSP
ncbi:MAG: family protein phosphatase [Pseudonocardiales bacterium]|nr:family protein phosphatase [Pseudonocardiales bacterium]